MPALLRQQGGPGVRGRGRTGLPGQDQHLGIHLTKPLGAAVLDRVQAIENKGRNQEQERDHTGCNSTQIRD